MVNVIQTIKNLKQQFPRFQVDTLLKIVECISEDEQQDTGMLLEGKHHKNDKTANNIKVL